MGYNGNIFANGEAMHPGTGRKTLYAEVGVRESASSEEVRAAYLQKAKEIHPDKVPEGPDREEAERKMTRLNAVMEVLGEEDKRTAYDAELRRQRSVEEAGLRKVAVAASLQVWQGSNGGPDGKRWWAYSFAAVVCVIIGWVTAVLLSDSRETQWWQVQGNRPAEPVAAAGVEKTKPAAKAGEPAPVRVERPAPEPVDRQVQPTVKPAPPKTIPQRTVEQNTVNPLVEEARRAMLRKQELPAAAGASPPAPVAAPAPVERRPAAVEKATAAAPNPSTNGGWNGNWKYIPAMGGGIGGSFHPVSIMVQMRTTGQKVRGFYRGKYQVDRRYAAQVEFFFEGWADSGDNLSGVWKDATGARGEFALKKVDAKVVEMNWWTTAFARKGALATGAARLVEMR